MSLKKITSLTMMLVMLVMTYTGIILFITPPGRIANWANWELLGLSKKEYGEIHSIFMVLFIIMTLIHVYYNWTPITNYMKNKAKEMIVLTKDMLIAFILVLIFFLGTLYQVTPFSSFLDFGDGIKNSWEKEYGTAPYSHAELSSFSKFTKKMGYDLEKSKEILKSNNIKFEVSQSLSQIGKENNLSPQFIYKLLSKNLEKAGEKKIKLTGLGRKTIGEVAETLGLSNKEFILKLKTLGIKAKENDKFKISLENYDKSPMDVMEELGYKKPE